MKEEIRRMLVDALNEVSPLLEEQVDYRDDLPLWSKKDAIFDSLGLVNFIATVESKIADTMNKDIVIVAEKAFSQQNSPFRTMETLGNFIEELLQESE
jgi:acyl carrier protein